MSSKLLGVVVALVMFAVMGDEWEVGTMKVVIWSGLGLTALCSLLLWTVRSELALEQIDSDAADVINSLHNDGEVIDDRKQSLTEKERDKEPDTDTAALNGEAPGIDGHESESSPLLGPAHGAHLTNSAQEGNTENDTGNVHTGRCGFLMLPARFAPYLLGAIGVFRSFGSGMTVMYFNLFLIEEFDTSPVQLQILNGSIIVILVVFSQLLALADSFGWNRFRIQVPPTTLGVAGIGILAVVSSGPLAQMWPTYTIFAVRKAAMNCRTGVVRALMMDMTPKSQRGRWNALESVTSATWATSAVVGGYVADATSYREAFMITFAFHGASLGMLMLMFRNRDPREWLKSEKK